MFGVVERSRSRSVVMAVSVLLFAACGSDTTSSMTTVTQSATAAPALTVASFSLEERLADGPVVLWFWAPGCGTCNSIAADVERAARASVGRAQFVGVSWYGNEASYRAFAERHGLTFPSVADDDGVLFTQFGVPTQPAFAFVATDGASTTVNGPLSAAEIERRVAELAG